MKLSQPRGIVVGYCLFWAKNNIIIEIHESAFREIILMIHYYLLKELINSDDFVTVY